ncbi:hypothetical protein A5678_25180 [Mycobacterium sp. E2733]|nr:hypothetical protein A5678_25180 [Mycobacterium sp. E2733]
MDEANSGAFADASAAPRASAISGSSGAVTSSGVAASSAGLTATMSVPQPTRNTPSARAPRESRPATIVANSAASGSSPASNSCWRCRSTMEPSVASTTASVAVPGSTNSIAMCA